MRESVALKQYTFLWVSLFVPHSKPSLFVCDKDRYSQGEGTHSASIQIISPVDLSLRTQEIHTVDVVCEMTAQPDGKV